MKIPLFKDGNPLNMPDEMHEIELSHPQAAQMAIENVASQADDTYFDASLEIRIDDKRFFKQFTTDAFGLWDSLLCAIEAPGKHHITFLDYPQDLTIIHSETYEFLYVHTDYEGDNDCLVSMTKKVVSSGPLPKTAVEVAIKESFKQYADFILQYHIPIAEWHKREIEQRKQELLKDEM